MTMQKSYFGAHDACKNHLAKLMENARKGGAAKYFGIFFVIFFVAPTILLL